MDIHTRAALAAGLLAALGGGARAEDKPDLMVLQRIRAEALDRGQAAEHLFWLTDANGPRLTGSAGLKRAGDWAVRTLQGWGASNARLEPWGTFGKGWSVARASAELAGPVVAPLHGYALAWCGSTSGPVTAEPVLAPLWERPDDPDRHDLARERRHVQEYIQAHRGQLKGKIVLLDRLRELEPPTKEAPASRYDEAKLAALAAAQDAMPPIPWTWPLQGYPPEKEKREYLGRTLPLEVLADYWARAERVEDPLWEFFKAEGVAGVLTTDRRGDGGLVFAESTGAYFADSPVPPPVMVLTPESYNRLVRLLAHGTGPKVTLDVQARFEPVQQGFNVVAELPGGKKRDEVVMLGGHLDSWHTGTGATDDGAGSAIALEAFRILKAAKVPLARTVRLALWSGEEQALYGSRGYVKEHFGDPVTMKLKPEHAKLAAYFNVDNGAGKIRGVYLQGNEAVRPVFEEWMRPLKDLGVTTLTIRNTGGTDHLSFDAVGLPGFQFIQDPLDYSTRTHHSELDTFDHAPAPDLMQAAAVLATFVYDAANRADPLPRKPLPAPLPPKQEPARLTSPQ